MTEETKQFWKQLAMTAISTATLAIISVLADTGSDHIRKKYSPGDDTDSRRNNNRSRNRSY